MFSELLSRSSTVDSTTKSALSSPRHSDRRRRSRSKVRWPVLIFRGSGPETVESVTEDVSSAGFFCFTESPECAFASGELITCTIRLPKHDVHRNDQTLTLLCKARVVRVVHSSRAAMGIACHIEDYCCWLKEPDWA